jgi:hypothetical protein
MALSPLCGLSKRSHFCWRTSQRTESGSTDNRPAGDVQGYEVWCAILALIDSAKTHAQAQHKGPVHEETAPPAGWPAGLYSGLRALGRAAPGVRCWTTPLNDESRVRVNLQSPRQCHAHKKSPAANGGADESGESCRSKIDQKAKANQEPLLARI